MKASLATLRRHAGNSGPLRNQIGSIYPAEVVAMVTQQQKTLLLVDDQHDELKLLKAILKCFGYKVLTANNGYGALKLFASECIDAVVLDYEMPVMDGAVLAGKMRRAKPAIPILMFSGCASFPQSVLRLLDGFVPKGVRPGFLIEALQRLLLPGEKRKPLRAAM